MHSVLTQQGEAVMLLPVLVWRGMEGLHVTSALCRGNECCCLYRSSSWQKEDEDCSKRKIG